MSDEREWSPEETWQRLHRDQPLFILDVRGEEQFRTWRVEGPRPIPTLNVPYFELLSLDEEEGIVASVKQAVPEKLSERLPGRDTPILAVCPEGHTSAYVAEGLRQLGWRAVNLAGGMAAWGDYYHIEPIVEDERLTIVQVSRTARGCLGHVVASKGAALVIDPARHIDVYRELLERRGWHLAGVLDTHMHADHISGGPALAKHAGTAYHLHPYDALHPIDLVPVTFGYEPLRADQRISLGEVELEVLFIPGHTVGEVAFLVDQRFLLAGDSIFLRSVARPDLGGKAETWTPLFYRSLRRLMELPDDVVVLPAHFSEVGEAPEPGRYLQPLGILKAQNEGLKAAAGEEDAFRRYIMESLPEFPPDYVDIKRINAGLLEADEQRMGDLELGKNVCALK